jgi:threonine dehydrogenase-like Zn-dependent dehydrogenase
MGAQRVIGIDHYPHRLELAKQLGAEVLNFKEAHVHRALVEMTGGIGPDAVIDAVGMESHGFALDNIIDYAEQKVMLESGRPAALRQAIVACRKGGRLSMPGVYGGFVDKFPLGALMEKGLTVRTGQTHVQKYLPMLLDKIRNGEIDTTFLICHRMPLEKAAEGYRMFSQEQNKTTKVVLKT